MGRLLLVLRLAVKDVRRHPAEALLLLVAIAAATTTLTVALALHGVTSAPYAATRAATAGPDVVAAVQQSGRPPTRLTALEHAPGVVDSSGPYLIATPNLVVDGHADPVMAEGRDPSACIRRPTQAHRRPLGHQRRRGRRAQPGRPPRSQGRRPRRPGQPCRRRERAGRRASAWSGRGAGPGQAGRSVRSAHPSRSSGSPSPRRSSLRRSATTPIRRDFPKRASSG